MSYEPLLLDEAVRVVCEHYGLMSADLQAGNRRKICVEARRMAMVAIRRLAPNITWEELASHFGFNSHSGAEYHVSEHEAWLNVDAVMRSEFEEILAQLRITVPPLTNTNP